MDYIYGNINNNLVTINRLEYVELRKCEIANQPIEGLNVGDFYLAFKVFDCKKLIYCNLAEMNQDIIDELNKKLAGKVDKIEKTNNWRVYGVGSKELDLPNGDSIDVSDQPIPNTLINRNANGTAQINNPIDAKDIANKQYIDKVIENIELRNDVVDIVGTYQELQSYNTSTLTANDIIKVLQDETHNNASSYYRWNTTFEYVGSEGPYYTQTKVDDKLDKKLDKVAKTDSWQVYGEGTDGAKLPYNNGRTIKISEKPEKYTLMNRGENGNCQVEKPINDKDIANKAYVDGKIDYIVFSDTIFSKSSTLTQTEYNDLYAFYNKHYNKDKIPLFAIDKNGSIASVSLETNYWVDFTLFNDRVSPITLSIQVSTDTGHSRPFSYNRGYLHNILGQDSWKDDIKARIGVNSDNKLIITDGAGNETPGQSPSVLIPPFTLEPNGYYTLDTGFKVDNLVSESVSASRDLYIGSSFNNLYVQQAMDYTNSTFEIRGIKLNDDGSPTSSFYKFRIGDGFGGTVVVMSDLANYTPISETNNIKALIPAQASKDNQLADKNFVNSSINSSAAYFIGSFATYADLLRWQNDNPTKATNNDYAYVEQDETHNNEGWRYIYCKTNEETVGTWKPQFKVNDTPFTAAQLAAINSNITSDKVTTFDNHVVNKENPHKVTKEQVGLGNVDNTSDLNKPLSTAASEALDNLNKVIPTDINAKSQFFYADLILEHNGQEIAGQKKLAKIPAWTLIDDADYPIPVKTFMKSQFINIVNLGINNDIFFPSLSESILFCKRDKDTNAWVAFDVDTTVKTIPGTTGIQILLTNANTKTINGENIYGSGNIEAIPVYDFTSLDFTNVLSTLSDEGYVSIDITDEAMKNDLKTIFDRLQNNKTSFIEFPQLQSGGTDESIQKTRMFALIQNSIYLGTGVYGLYGLMYFYSNSDMLIKIRIDTNFDSYYGIVLENVENKFINKSSVKKIVYATNSEGAQINLPFALIPGNSNLAQFDTNGHLYTNTPSVDLHATNKKYVDNNFEKKTILSNVLPTNNILLDLHNYQLESPITSDFSFIMPANASDEYLSEISFTTGPTLVTFTTTSAITFTGEDCSNTHTFVPDTNKHYNIIFWKDKAGFQAVVRGY